MLKLVLKLSLLNLILIITACDIYKPYRPRNEVVFEREVSRFSDSDRSNFSGSCRRNEESDKVSVREFDYIDSNNAGEYILQGRCDTKDATVFVRVNGYDITNNPICDNKRWKVELNLTSIISAQDSVVFEITHDNESICKDVRVAFSGPTDYIPVPTPEQANGDYYESSFFVMKYEAKVETRNAFTKAVSKAEGVPVSNITLEDAVDLCKNNGPRYDLMSNAQWQSIVLSIEDTDENWRVGKSTATDDNAINCGVLTGRPQPARSNDIDDCADQSCNPNWDLKRRTHILKNGEVIWDICGNVGEIMKDKYKANQNFRGDIFELKGQLKKLFGPNKTYSLADNNRRLNKWNLGEADIRKNNDLIVRGMPDRYAGIFSVEVKRDHDDRRGDLQVGFRCVYLP